MEVTMNVFSSIFLIPSWILQLWSWLTTPAIFPWLGAFAAILAALSVDTRHWLREPTKFLIRALRVAVIWLLAAWLLSAAWGSASGRSQGGSQAAMPLPPPVVVIRPSVRDMPETTDVLVEFLPRSAGDPTTAEEFCCRLLYKNSQGQTEQMECRVGNMAEFDASLKEAFRRATRASNPNVRIISSPSPGTGVLLRVEQIIDATLPGANVEFDEGTAP
jgi:hypothetical protein